MDEDALKDRPIQHENGNPYQSPRPSEEEASNVQRTNWLRWFRIGFLCWGMFPMAATVMRVATNQNPGVLLILTVAWLLVGIRLYAEGKAAFFTAFVIVVFWWLIGGFLTGMRIFFVIDNQGMERADGFGSPAAFLLRVAFEQIVLFIPMSILLGLGIAAILSRRR